MILLPHSIMFLRQNYLSHVE